MSKVFQIGELQPAYSVPYALDLDATNNLVSASGRIPYLPNRSHRNDGAYEDERCQGPRW